MTYLTIWHYGAFLSLFALFIVTVIYALRNHDLAKSKFSVIFTFAAVTAALMFMASLTIDQYTKEVTLMNFKNHRFYATEQIIFEGAVRNTGAYPVAKVELEIKLVNKDRGLKTGDPQYQSTAFEEFFGQNSKDLRPSFVILNQTIATDLLPGQTHQFRIAMDHPTHFKGFTVYPRIFAK